MDVNSTNSSVTKFPKEGSFEYFVEDFLLKNHPCLFVEWFTSQWRARRLWVDQHGQPNLHYLRQHYGECVVPVANCGLEHFSTHPKTDMKLSDYLDYWGILCKEQHEEGADGGGENGSGMRKLLYLKDWHLARERPEDTFYTTMEHFQSDWMNEVWSNRQDVNDDYRFVYMGPAGTWSYSWSTNVCGKKEWLLFPPGQEEYLRDRLGNLPFDVCSEDLQDRARYPNASKTCEPVRVIQNAGETIFVPSGWYHQVRNLEDTISINHNWTNAFGILSVWKHLQSELQLVFAELDDCRAMEGWHDHCQVVLRASAGMHYWEFTQLLCIVGLPRLREVLSLLSTLPLPAGKAGDLLTAIEENFSKITSSSRKLTFFEGGVLPVTFHLDHPGTVADNLSSGDISTDGSEAASAEKTNCSSFAALVPRLPNEFQELVLSDTFKDSSLQRTRSLLIFRLFELNTINDIFDQLLPCVYI